MKFVMWWRVASAWAHAGLKWPWNTWFLHFSARLLLLHSGPSCSWIFHSSGNSFTMLQDQGGRSITAYISVSSLKLVIHITFNWKKILRLHEQAGVRLTSLLELTQGFHCLPFMWSNFKGEIFFEHPFFLWFLFKWNSLWDSDIYVKIVRDKSLRQTLRGNPEVLSDAFPWQQHPKVWCTSSSKAQQRAFPWCLPFSLSLSLNPSHISNH